MSHMATSLPHLIQLETSLCNPRSKVPYQWQKCQFLSNLKTNSGDQSKAILNTPAKVKYILRKYRL
jgi:hypothetical protein